MDSFYGGKQGISFVIKASFKSVEEMRKNFALGASYTDVSYGEYCLIDTDNKNDPSNGEVYYRGLDYQNTENNGAVYIGQIVGPSSGTPLFQMSTIKEVIDKTQEPLGEFGYRCYPTGYKTDEEGHVIGYTITDSNDETNPPIATFPFNKAHDTSLVPGKYIENGEIKYKDEITWTWCNIRSNNKNTDSWFYVGFEIPYMVIDYQTKTVSAYDDVTGEILENPVTMERTDDGEHPFYMGLELGIPKGIKGDSLRNLKIITPTEDLKGYIYTPQDIVTDETTGEISFSASSYVGIDDDIKNNRKILVYEYYFYDKRKNPNLIDGDMVYVYLGDYNVISKVDLDKDGTLVISYTHDDAQELEEKIQWIENVSLNNETGSFDIKYNTQNEQTHISDLNWIKDIQLDPDGTLRFYHTVDGKIDVKEKEVKYIDTLSVGTKNPGWFEVLFNTGESLGFQLNWVTDVDIDQETGNLIISYADPEYGTEDNGQVVIPALFKMIISADASNDGILSFRTNTDETILLKQTGNTEENFRLKVIDQILVQTGINDDKHIQIKYNTSNEYVPIGDPINYIEDIVVRESDLHLLVLFSDPSYRHDIAVDGPLAEDGTGKYGAKWVTGILGSSGQIYDKVYWRDYGTIKDQSGILVGLNVSPEDLGDLDIITYLNKTYPNGLTGGNYSQKVVTFGDFNDLNAQKNFYAFDYNKYKWYYLGQISDSGVRDAVIFTEGQYNDDDVQDLSINGIAFIKINNSVNISDVPKYWTRNYSGA